MTNFKQENFTGTLLELLACCNGHLSSIGARLREHHEWLMAELSHTPNLLPIRKGHVYRERGGRVEVGSRTYLIADNEPLASQFEFLLDQERRPAGTFRELLQSGRIAASWRADVPGAAGLRFRGVGASFRQQGLKLAHVFDAADGLDQVGPLERQMEVRFLRSQSPLNVFLFPSPRVCTITVTKGPRPSEADLGEEPLVRRVALGYLVELLGMAPGRWDLFRSGISSLDLETHEDWKAMARSIELEVRPKSGAGLQKRAIASPHAVPRQGPAGAAAGARWTTPRTALDPDEAIELLRSWLADHPESAQLDGRPVRKNNPSQWLHLRIDGFEGERLFTSRYGPVFDGDDYNGVVNFHGDTPVEALRTFVDLYDDAESILDVLSPSATYETKTLPVSARTVKPKFALKGRSEGVEGFFMYHDEHAGKAVTRHSS